MLATQMINPQYSIGMKKKVCLSRSAMSSPLFLSTSTRVGAPLNRVPKNQIITPEMSNPIADGQLCSLKYCSLPEQDSVNSCNEIKIPKVTTRTRNPFLVHTIICFSKSWLVQPFGMTYFRAIHGQ